MIVIITIYDMSKQEFSLCERVYIHNTYMKSRKSCSETRRKFPVKFPNPSTIRRKAKRFKETGSTAVEQVVACALITQRARVRSPVGTSFLGEVFSGFFLTCKTNVGKL